MSKSGFEHLHPHPAPLQDPSTYLLMLNLAKVFWDFCVPSPPAPFSSSSVRGRFVADMMHPMKNTKRNRTLERTGQIFERQGLVRFLATRFACPVFRKCVTVLFVMRSLNFATNSRIEPGDVKVSQQETRPARDLADDTKNLDFWKSVWCLNEALLQNNHQSL